MMFTPHYVWLQFDFVLLHLKQCKALIKLRIKKKVEEERKTKTLDEKQKLSILADNRVRFLK